ncbi:MAG: succinylglutamate desuccinylase/aspartoacylase family protein [Beggiatoa sp.]|nr:succinylglutamate desuccinylase/aspartoacylase family protein [Beggiatoa sp.]
MDTALTQPPIHIGGVEVPAGERRLIDLPVPHLYTSEKGPLAARLAHVFFSEIAALSTHGIDLHTGAMHRDNLPQVRALTDDPETMRMARAFDAPVLINTALVDGSIRKALARRGIPIVVYEAGEALRFDEVAIRVGVHGVLSVMRYLRMLPHRQTRQRRIEPLEGRSSGWCRWSTRARPCSISRASNREPSPAPRP